MDPLAHIQATLLRLEAKVDALQGKPKASLTRVEFARAAHISARTVSRKIGLGLILTQKGRIPYSELAKWVS